MKQILVSGLLILFCTGTVLAQDKIEAPNLNVGDKWIFNDGTTIQVIGKDENSYKIKFEKETFLLDRATLNRISPVQGKRQLNRGPLRKLLDFPLVIGKSWKDNYSTQLKWEDEFTSKTGGYSMGDETLMFESYRVLGWEALEVHLEHLKTIKVEYKREWSSPNGGMREGKAWYWYSPEIKNIVRLQFDKSQVWSQCHDLLLESFSLKE